MNWAELAAKVGLDPKTYTSTTLLNELCRRFSDLEPTTLQGQGPQVASTDDPQADFEKLSELYAKSHGVTLAEGYRQVSIQAPILYERATNRARLN